MKTREDELILSCGKQGFGWGPDQSRGLITLGLRHCYLRIFLWVGREAPSDSPHFLLSLGVSTRRFCEQKHSRARRKSIYAQKTKLLLTPILNDRPPPFSKTVSITLFIYFRQPHRNQYTSHRRKRFFSTKELCLHNQYQEPIKFDGLLTILVNAAFLFSVERKYFINPILPQKVPPSPPLYLGAYSKK